MSDKKFAEDYIDVAQRIAEFRTKHPEGALQPADLAKPYTIETIGERTFIVVVAAAYRSPDDPKPGIGMAYEQFPGATPFTRNSELQNAETSAWGRAIQAALAADTRRGVASQEEVRNRRAEEGLRAAEASALAGVLLRDINQAANPDELEEVGKRVLEAKKGGRIEEAQYLAVTNAGKERRRFLATTVPVPPEVPA